jgi:hypothetical protein
MSERDGKGFGAVLMTIVGVLLLLFGGGCLLFSLDSYFRSVEGIGIGLFLLAGGIIFIWAARNP